MSPKDAKGGFSGCYLIEITVQCDSDCMVISIKLQCKSYAFAACSVPDNDVVSLIALTDSVLRESRRIGCTRAVYGFVISRPVFMGV